METLAVVLEAPEKLSLKMLELKDAGRDDVIVDVDFSGISTGTERLLWSGRMPPFPGMGYPLVPGYESVGRVVDAGGDARDRIGQTVFIPGSTGFIGARGLFGGAAQRLIAPSARVIPIHWPRRPVTRLLMGRCRPNSSSAMASWVGYWHALLWPKAIRHLWSGKSIRTVTVGP
ncbi:MAG: hypothetical protein RL230_1975 [Pseudomonadota bacterium]